MDESSATANNIDDPTIKYPCLFRWTKKVVSNVFVGGSFNNWGTLIPLEAEPDTFDRGILYTLTLYLPPGIHYYKFLVDNEWKYDPELAFAADEFGNLNNFIDIVSQNAQQGSSPQEPTKSILRDTNSEFASINPEAVTAANNIREFNLGQVDLRASEEDLEYSLDPKERKKAVPNASSTGNTRFRSSSSSLMSRSHSETSLKSLESIHLSNDVTVKKDVVVKNLRNSFLHQNTQTVLLAARTAHFGGDLVTQEHQLREDSGGHRSILSEAKSDKATSFNVGLIIFLVGKPGRGKTFIGHILCRHLTWMGHASKLFNVGSYREKAYGSKLTPDFWNPANVESVAKRQEVTIACLNDALDELDRESSTSVIFDATNCTIERRQMLQDAVRTRGAHKILFLESIINDAHVLASLIHEMKLNSADYRATTLCASRSDYNNRIAQYESLYETLSSDKEGHLSFLQVINAGQQLYCNSVYGYLESRIILLMANFHLYPRPIWLSRHGQSEYNVGGKIGGDSPLSPSGVQYADQLDRFIEAHYPSEGSQTLSCWSSTMCRTGMTIKKIQGRGRSVIKWKQLDEIDAGICDGLTYAEVADKYPEEYESRKLNKLHYRYPRGESYQDVIHRLEPVITELMRQKGPILIVAHQAILRVLYGYLTNRSPQECPVIDIPLHKVIQLTPKAYKCEEVWHSPM